LALVSAPSALAQSLSLSIAPPIVEVMVKPGTTTTQAYEVVNNADSSYYLTVRLVPFFPVDNQGGVELQLDDRQALSQARIEGVEFLLQNANLDWGETFLLPPGGKKQLVLKVKISPNATQKDYYLTFLVEQSSQGEFVNRTQSRSLAKIGAHLLLTVSQSGQPRQKLAVSRFEAKPKIADIFNPVGLELIISNDGDSFVKPIGEMVITGWRGPAAKLNIRPDNILSKASRLIQCWDEEDVPCQFRSFIPGKYHARVAFSPELKPDQVIEAEVTFWLLPIKLALVLVVAGGLVLLVWQKKTRKPSDRD